MVALEFFVVRLLLIIQTKLPIVFADIGQYKFQEFHMNSGMKALFFIKLRKLRKVFALIHLFLIFINRENSNIMFLLKLATVKDQTKPFRLTLRDRLPNTLGKKRREFLIRFKQDFLHFDVSVNKCSMQNKKRYRAQQSSTTKRRFWEFLGTRMKW